MKSRRAFARLSASREALPFAAEAVEELENAAAWYERERPGYGALFLAEVRAKAGRAARFPRTGSAR